MACISSSFQAQARACEDLPELGGSASRPACGRSSPRGSRPRRSPRVPGRAATGRPFPVGRSPTVSLGEPFRFPGRWSPRAPTSFFTTITVGRSPAGAISIRQPVPGATRACRTNGRRRPTTTEQAPTTAPDRTAHERPAVRWRCAPSTEQHAQVVPRSIRDSARAISRRSIHSFFPFLLSRIARSRKLQACGLARWSFDRRRRGDFQRLVVVQRTECELFAGASRTNHFHGSIRQRTFHFDVEQRAPRCWRSPRIAVTADCGMIPTRGSSASAAVMSDWLLRFQARPAGPAVPVADMVTSLIAGAMSIGTATAAPGR